MTKRSILAVSTVAMVAGCGGSYPAVHSSAHKTPHSTPPAAVAPGGEVSAKASTMDIAKAAMPFKVLRTRGGTEIAAETFFDELASTAAICVGETHPNPHHHWAQLQVLEELAKRSNGRNIALGMEMFQRPFQGVLDDYAAGRIDERALLSRTDWANRWGYDFALYRALLVVAARQKMAILALNISTELKNKIKRKGIDGLTAKERARVPEVDLGDAEHKAWFDDLMAEMGGPHGHGSQSSGKGSDKEKAERARKIYLSQVLWDEAMADTAARWLAGGDNRQIVVVAGSGHCHDSAIVRRMRRRGADPVVSVRPVMLGNEAKELAAPQTDYLFVLVPHHSTATGTKQHSGQPH